MAPSLFSTLSSVLLLTSSVSAHKSYQVVDSYDSTNFLDKFGFFVSDHSSSNYNDVDPTGGYVSYKSAEEAQSMGILKTVGEDLYLGVDSKSVLDPNGIGRSSVRIESKSKYKQGLFIATFSHLPKPVCGAWPAFWTVGNPWPDAGEIDIVETWNEDNVNKVVLHTDERIGECRIDGKGMTGTVSKPNCANFAVGQADNEGCAGLDPAAPFGSAEGGVYAMQWTDDAIKVWGFTHANVPADIATNPNPENWGVPSFTTSTCAADKLFGEAKLVMNINLCGVAGQDGIWDSCKAKAGGATCKEWVAKNPAAFAEVYFQLKSVKVYSLKEAEATPSSVISSQLASTAVASTAAETTVVSTSAAAETAVVSSVVVSSAVASEKPVETVSASASAPASTSVIASEKPIETPIETPAESLTTRLATSTVYETNIKTITSCAPEVTNCPAKDTPVVVTEVVPVTTTICPVYDVPTQLTISKTEVVTVTSCAPEVPNCPARTSTLTTQEIIPTTTAIPVESYVPPKPTADKPVVTVSSQKPVDDVTTALTTYKTNIVTITSCAPEVPDCPARTSTIITSEVIPTTVPAVPATTEAEKPVVTEEPPVQMTTYKTNIVTITSCAPDVPNCPARTSTVITSEIVPAPTTEGEKPVPVTTEVEKPVVTEQPPVQITTYKTNIITITSCAPDVPNCPARTSTIVTSEIVPVPTTEVEKPVPVPTTEGEKPVPVPTTEAEKPVPVTTEIPTVLTTFKTNIVTITSCAPEVPDCPARTSTIVTSELISTTVPVPGVPGKPTDVSQNPPVPGTEKPATTPAVPGNGEPITTPAVPGGEEPATTPVAPGKPTTPAPEYSTISKDEPSAPGSPKPSNPGAGVPTVGVPVPGETTSAQKPVPETPGVPATDVATATAPPAAPTTLVVAPSSPYNGTLTTARIPVGTGVTAPCIGAACPATTTGPVQAGAGKVGSGAFLLAAALAALAI
ncbi:Putative glycoside hydrolase family 16, concanavalin A-like lectin/glucanase domain superfamily [Colletotrichum destructivum]|uniref:Glycoside hydrolase family 16, concanavalin A-like lectin/glucanase domain superfamily n=1 Tax=Colletotrichum destructivum TaxID=34406 RepID=A0AAX4IRR5_9PEZI|nr:Putative glycoside hydrolase family 16, concanavalin A-like lectin/glucanase domain superfamily [Colletotrichum destructivum]